MKDKVASQDGDSFWDKIVNFFKNLFGGDDDDQATINAPSDDTGEDAATVDSNNTDTPDDSDTTDSVPSDDTADDAGEDLTINTEE